MNGHSVIGVYQTLRVSWRVKSLFHLIRTGELNTKAQVIKSFEHFCYPLRRRGSAEKSSANTTAHIQSPFLMYTFAKSCRRPLKVCKDSHGHSSLCCYSWQCFPNPFSPVVRFQ